MEQSELPEGWGWKPLSECISQIQYGSSAKASTEPIGIPVIRMGNIDNGIVSADDLKYLSLPEAEKQRYLLNKGDVLINRTNSAALVGKAGIFDLDGEFIFASYLLRLRIRSEIAVPAFINYVINTSRCQGILKSRGKDAIGQTNINSQQIKKLTIPLPPLPEQRRIVARIEEFTSRLYLQSAAIDEQLRELNALLAATYTAIAEDAPREPFDKVATHVRRKVDAKPDESFTEMGIRSFGKGTFKKPALTGRQLGKKKVFHIHKGDLVFNNVFSWEGAIAVAQVEDHGRVGSHRFITYVPNPGRSTSEFLCYHFLSNEGIEDIRSASPGSAGRNRTLGLTKLAAIEVPVPEYSEQVRFHELATRKREIVKLRAAIAADISTFTPALLDKAFRGEI